MLSNSFSCFLSDLTSSDVLLSVADPSTSSSLSLSLSFASCSNGVLVSGDMSLTATLTHSGLSRFSKNVTSHDTYVFKKFHLSATIYPFLFLGIPIKTPSMALGSSFPCLSSGMWTYVEHPKIRKLS